MVGEWLDEILQSLFNNAQGGIRSVVYGVFEKVLLHLPRKQATGAAMEGHIVKFSDSDAAAKGW